jgi:hypothetical protein
MFINLELKLIVQSSATSGLSMSPASSSSFLLAARLAFLSCLLTSSDASLLPTHSLMFFLLGMRGNRANDTILQISDIKTKVE